MKNKLPTLLAALGEFAQSAATKNKGIRVEIEYSTTSNRVWVHVSREHYGTISHETSEDFDTASQMVASLKTDLETFLAETEHE